MPTSSSSPRLTPIRRMPDKSPCAYGVALGLFFALFFFVPAVTTGHGRWLWWAPIGAGVVTVLLLLERRFPNNRAYLVLSGILPLVGLFLLLSAVLHLWTAFYLREAGIISAPWLWPEPGIWLFCVGSGVVLAIFFNVCILMRLNVDAVVDRMERIQAGMTVEHGVIYFLEPASLHYEETGLSPGLYRALCWTRIYAIGLCVVGGVLAITSIFRSLGRFDALLEAICTIGVGLGILSLRLWMFPVIRAFQRRWEHTPAEQALRLAKGKKL